MKIEGDFLSSAMCEILAVVIVNEPHNSYVRRGNRAIFYDFSPILTKKFYSSSIPLVWLEFEPLITFFHVQ